MNAGVEYSLVGGLRGCFTPVDHERSCDVIHTASDPLQTSPAPCGGEDLKEQSEYSKLISDRHETFLVWVGKRSAGRF